MGMKVLAADGISPKGIELLQKEFEVVVKDKISARVQDGILTVTLPKQEKEAKVSKSIEVS